MAPGAAMDPDRSTSSTDRSLREEVVRSTDLLLRAVQRLKERSVSDSQQPTLTPSTGVRVPLVATPPTVPRPHVNSPVAARFGLGAPVQANRIPGVSSTATSSSELKSLFHWIPSKRDRAFKSGTGKSKKKKLMTWTHTFCCLASMTQK